MLRQPVVAGQFYPGDKHALISELERLIFRTREKKKAKGVIVPHAGYAYSGGIAGNVFGRIDIPSSALILGPNHHGQGHPLALFPQGEWLTPLGLVPVDSGLNGLLRKNCRYLKEDSIAHRFEHSLEVLLPFLQILNPEITFSAVCLGLDDFEILRETGEGIATAIRESDMDVLIVASSDMTHYESDISVRRKDDLALSRILDLDPEGLLRVCRSEAISMCGAVAAAVMLVALRNLGATRAELLAYGTSGDVTGDVRQVVGYAGVLVE